MEHGLLHYVGVAFVALGLVNLAKAGYYYIKGKSDNQSKLRG